MASAGSSIEKVELSTTKESEKPPQEDMDSNDDDDDDDDDDDESETSGEDLEPKLKYDRMGNDLSQILSKDAASCIAVHPKFLALGTHWGYILVLDHLGNCVSEKNTMPHSTTVNQISIDDNGDYMASCSDDGRVVIQGLYQTEHNQSFTMDRPVKAVALDPQYGKHGRTKQFVTGDTALILNERGGLFNRHKVTTLHSGDGAIRNIKWKSDFVAWANDMGVKVYDMSTRLRITHIDKDHSLRPELYGCSLFWKDNRTLMVGWGDCVKICQVKDRVQTDQNRHLPSRYVEIIALFKTDFYICGLSSMDENVLVLTYEKDQQQKELASRPHLRLLEPHMKHYEELSNDALSIRGFSEYRCSDYMLECIAVENLFFIVSPKDIVVARLRDQDDHITWLLEHDMYEEAMAEASVHAKELRKHTLETIGRDYLQYLLTEEAFDEAAQLCMKIFGKSKELWEDVIYKFSELRQLQAIAPYLPRSDPQLSPAIYELVLNDFLQKDLDRFLQLLQDWPQELYHTETIINAVLIHLDRMPTSTPLLRSLALLYAHQRAFDKALTIYLKLKHKDVFQLIHKHSLFDAISDKIVQLMEFDVDQAVKMFIDNIDKIPMIQVVQQLKKNERYLFLYLDGLWNREVSMPPEYHAQLVRLYAEYMRPKLLPFLRRSEAYPLEVALEECQNRQYHKEAVFLLGRIGNVRQALVLIMEKLQDVNYAVNFCTEQADEELWDDLIRYSMDKPDFLRTLLQNVGAHIDPIKVIERIQKGMEVPDLRDSLVKILQDYNLQISLREGCRRILVADSFNLMERLVRTHKRGYYISEKQICQICQNELLVNDLRFASNLITFHCHHSFHLDCLPSLPNGKMSCTICTTQKRGPGGKDHFMK